MRFSAPFVLLCLLAACSTAAPDDRAIQVISETPALAAEPVETEVIAEADGETPEDETRPVVDTSAQCDEDTYKPLVGQQAGGMQFPVGPRLRVFGVNDIITQELVPQRTNIVVDDSGKIVRVYCG